MTTKSCPISQESVDASVVRINSFYVGSVFAVFVLTQNPFIILFLVLDFITRIFLNKEYSLLIQLSKKTKKLLKMKSEIVDNAPKKLASYFGLTFVVAIFIATLFGFSSIVYSLSIVLGACIFLEVAFSYCLGCEVYHLYKRFVV